MIALGVILVLLAVVAVVAAITGASGQLVTLDLGLFDVQTDSVGVFLVGALTVVLLLAGLALVRGGLRRARRRRQDKKQLSRLTEQLEAQRSEDGTSTRPTSAGEPTLTDPDRREP